MIHEEQGKAAASTLGLGDAFRGLGIRIKSALASLGTFLTTNPLGWLTIIGGAIAAVAVGINLYEKRNITNLGFIIMKTFWTKPPKNRICSVQMKDEHCAE